MVAIVAPGGRDAAVIDGILRSAGIERSVETMASLLNGVVPARFAAALVAEEALSDVPPAAIAQAVEAQPPWSDFPFVVLSRRGRSHPTNPALQVIRNVTQVERPVHPATLLGTVRSALRARARQEETSAHLAARQAAEAELRALTQSLEARVAERTAELSIINAQLHREIAERGEAEARVSAMQHQLLHLSRLSAMGTMGATIAHELNQPLAVILNYMRGAEHLMARLDDAPQDLQHAIGGAAANAHRAGTIIRSLRDLVQHRPIDRRAETVRSLFEEAKILGLIDSTARAIECRTDIRPGVDQVLVDRVQIQQVLINLIRNAVDALEGCATRTIILAAAPCADGRVELSVSDTGPGFAPTAMAGETVSVKTSKPEGLGIGLSICRTILEEHGSSLVAVNNPTGGATIRFHLPGA